MPPATKRAVIAGALVLCVAAVAAGLYLHNARRVPVIHSAGLVPDIVSELPTDAPGIAYIDVATLRKMQGSTFAALLGLAGPGPTEDRDYQQFVLATGFDYSHDLDHVAIAFWPASQFEPPNDLDANRVVAIADGRFDQEKIKAYALRTGKTSVHGGRLVYEVPGTPPVAFEFLSPTRICLASGRDAADLLDPPKSAARDASMNARIIDVAAAPIFAVVRTEDLPTSVYDTLRSSPQLERMARSIKSLKLAGQPAGDNIMVVLEGECDSTTDALEIATLLDGFRIFGSMALTDPKARGQMTRGQATFLMSVLREVKVRHEDRYARLMLDLTPAMLAPPSTKVPETTKQRAQGKANAITESPGASLK
jgi:hypothetical protein